MKLGLDVDGSVVWRIVWMISIRQREETGKTVGSSGGRDSNMQSIVHSDC